MIRHLLFNHLRSLGCALFAALQLAPAAAAETPQIESQFDFSSETTPAARKFRFATVPGRRYTLWRSTDLKKWTAVAGYPGVTFVNNVLTYTGGATALGDYGATVPVTLTTPLFPALRSGRRLPQRLSPQKQFLSSHDSAYRILLPIRGYLGFPKGLPRDLTQPEWFFRPNSPHALQRRQPC